MMKVVAAFSFSYWECAGLFGPLNDENSRPPTWCNSQILFPFAAVHPDEASGSSGTFSGMHAYSGAKEVRIGVECRDSPVGKEGSWESDCDSGGRYLRYSSFRLNQRNAGYSTPRHQGLYIGRAPQDASVALSTPSSYGCNIHLQHINHTLKLRQTVFS